MSYVQSGASAAVCLPPGTLPRAYIRWWEANTSVCTPLRTPISCTRTSPSSSTTPVRWEPKSRENLREHLQLFPSASVPPAGGGGEPRPAALPGVRQGAVPGLRAAARGRALHPRPALALRPLAGAQLLRQLLVVVTAEPTRLSAAKSDLFAELI